VKIALESRGHGQFAGDVATLSKREAQSAGLLEPFRMLREHHHGIEKHEQADRAQLQCQKNVFIHDAYDPADTANNLLRPASGDALSSTGPMVARPGPGERETWPAGALRSRQVDATSTEIGIFWRLLRGLPFSRGR
jgi:hypothetical protein